MRSFWGAQLLALGRPGSHTYDIQCVLHGDVDEDSCSRIVLLNTVIRDHAGYSIFRFKLIQLK